MREALRAPKSPSSSCRANVVRVGLVLSRALPRLVRVSEPRASASASAGDVVRSRERSKLTSVQPGPRTRACPSLNCERNAARPSDELWRLMLMRTRRAFERQSFRERNLLSRQTSAARSLAPRHSAARQLCNSGPSTCSRTSNADASRRARERKEARLKEAMHIDGGPWRIVTHLAA